MSTARPQLGKMVRESPQGSILVLAVLYIFLNISLLFRIRPQDKEHTDTRLLIVVKLCAGPSVLGFVTTREYGLLYAFWRYF